MFVQVVKGKAKDPDAVMKLMDRWDEELKADAPGFLGSTGGVTDEGQMVAIARFESAEDAKANSDRPEQDAWAKEMAEVVDDVTFIDCTDVDLMLDGGSDAAGFVQVMEGTASDRDRLRTVGQEAESQLREMRPDVLGGVIAWHPDGQGFTQAVYFESEAKARENEASSEGPPDEMRDLMRVDSYYDLHKPRMS